MEVALEVALEVAPEVFDAVPEALEALPEFADVFDVLRPPGLLLPPLPPPLP